MALLTNLTVLLLLACVSHQLALSSSQRSPGRRGRSPDRGHHRPGRHPKSVPAQTFQGKLVTRAKEDCSWTAAGEDVLVLRVSCRKGDSSFSCEYEARPAACPQYSSNVRLYWKQVARSLRKQKRLCRDGEALVRTGLCRRAARDAHFRLREERRSPPRPPPRLPARPPAEPLQPSTAGSCRSDNKKLAEEYCNDSWSSLCTFFFTMMKDNDC